MSNVIKQTLSYVEGHIGPDVTIVKNFIVSLPYLYRSSKLK